MAPKLHILAIPAGEERALIDGVRAGAPDALEMLHHRYLGRVFALARQVLGDEASAEDAAQETFLRVFRSIHRFRGDASIATWIHRIAVNVCLTELGRRRREVRAPADDESPPSLEGQVDDRQLAGQLAAVLRRLPVEKQITFYLHHIEGMSASEIAEVLGQTRDAVLKRLQRTRREVLDAWRGSARPRHARVTR